VCAALLKAVGQWTKPRYQRNVQADRVRSILTALEPAYDPATPAERVLADFARVVPNGPEAMGDLTVYRYLPDGRPAAIAVRFAGKGLWGDIEGFLVLEPDLLTIRGLAITRQQETPGLGGQIVSAGFRAQWVGRKTIAPDGPPGVVIAMTRKAAAINEVDGITGATHTCTKLQDMINDAIVKLAKERERDER
jgi:Na+-transporting NADH:ubiquinone oxidoreductase subunit C